MASPDEAGGPPDSPNDPVERNCRMYKLLVNLKRLQESISRIKTDGEGNDGKQTLLQSDQAIRNQTDKLKNELDYIISSLEKLDAFEANASDLGDRIDELSATLPPAGGAASATISNKLREINRIVFDLRVRIPLPYMLSSKDAHGDWSNKTQGADELPNLHFHTQLLESTTFKDFRVVYQSLPIRTKICLSCFAAITENETVRKSFMIKWWVSEGFLRQEEAGATGKYEEADRIFEELVRKHCIELVNGKGSFIGKSYKMNPFIRSAVIEFAKEAGLFDFNEEKGHPTAICTSSFRACLVDGFFQESEKRISELKGVSELVMKLSNELGKTESQLIKKFSKDSRKRDYALVDRLWEIELDPILDKKLIEWAIDFELEKISPKDLGKRDSTFIKGLNAKHIESDLVERLKNNEMYPTLVKRLLKEDSMLLKVLTTDCVKRESELDKNLQEIQVDFKRLLKKMDSKLIKRLLKTDADFGNKLLKMEPKVLERLLKIDPQLAKRFSKDLGKGRSILVKRFCKGLGKRNFALLNKSCEIEISSTLVKTLRELDPELGKRLLKMKIGARLVKTLFKIDEHGEMVVGFFRELATGFSNLKEIPELRESSKLNEIFELVKRCSRKSREKVAEPVSPMFGDVGTRLSSKLEDVGAQLGHPKVLRERGPVSIIGSSKPLGEIGAQLINRFSKVLRKRCSTLYNEFSRDLQRLCDDLHRELSHKMGKVGAELISGSSEGWNKGGTGSINSLLKEFQDQDSKLSPEKVQAIFNVNEPYPDYFHPDWFSRLKNIKVLYLGRWQTSNKHHIEVKNIEFLKGLESMELLKFLSLQGISRIEKLPDSMCKLLNLRFLDLRACHNLEELPEGIGSLKELTHLDISECYMLNHMPKAIRSLLKLQVLKGFVISSNSNAKSCTLEDLLKLKKLGKLGIYTKSHTFPTENDVTNLQNFEQLRKLTITWGPAQIDEDACDQKKERCAELWKHVRDKLCKCAASKNKEKEKTIDARAIIKLVKLDLRCYPDKKAPNWLLPGRFPNLEKLYIRGGKLQNLHPVQGCDPWHVKILRLEFLKNLKLERKELRTSFPLLVREINCHELNFFPSKEN